MQENCNISLIMHRQNCYENSVINFLLSSTIYICRDSLACSLALIFLKVEFRGFCQPPTRLYSVCGRRPWCCSRVSNEARDRRTVLQRKRLDGEETREERRRTRRKNATAGLNDERRMVEARHKEEILREGVQKKKWKRRRKMFMATTTATTARQQLG